MFSFEFGGMGILIGILRCDYWKGESRVNLYGRQFIWERSLKLNGNTCMLYLYYEKIMHRFQKSLYHLVIPFSTNSSGSLVGTIDVDFCHFHLWLRYC